MIDATMSENPAMAASDPVPDSRKRMLCDLAAWAFRKPQSAIAMSAQMAMEAMETSRPAFRSSLSLT